MLTTLHNEEPIAHTKNGELEGPSISQEKTINVKACVEFTIEDDAFPLILEETSTYLHEVEILTSPTSSIIDKSLVSHHDIPF